MYSLIISAVLLLGNVALCYSLELSPYDITDDYLNKMLLGYNEQQQQQQQQQQRDPFQQFYDYQDTSDYDDFVRRTLRQPLSSYAGNSLVDLKSPYLATLDDPAQLALLDDETLAQMNLLQQQQQQQHQQQNPVSLDREMLQHSTLWGNQLMSGGAGEGVQHLGPVGSIENMQLPKTDSMLPAYCEPPNPCPLGYTEEDGCLVRFENTASFSRQYQSRQQCTCDTDHMFQCADSTDQTAISALARSLANKGLSGTEVRDLLLNEPQSSGAVAKKYKASKHVEQSENPYFTGPILPVAAKKGVNLV